MIFNNRNNKPLITEGAVVITGASTGIGKAIALGLDKLGFDVFAGVRKQEDGDRLKAEASDKLTPIILDVTKQGMIDEAVKVVETAVSDKGIIGLVNNAGVATGGPMEFVPLDEMRWVFEVNLFGVVAVTQAFMPLLRKAKGRIVNISSIAGHSASPFMGPYAASKHALEAISDAMRVEIAPWGMHVALIKPGAVATPIWDKTLATTDRLMEILPPEATAYYGTALTFVLEFVAIGEGIPADDVALLTIHALTAAAPKTRYLIGKDAKMQSAVERLPDRLRDRVILNQLPKFGLENI